MARHRLIALLVILLVFFGLIMVASASVVDAARDFGDKWYYLKLQSVWAALGLVVFFLVSRWPHQRLAKYARPLFWLTTVLLLAVLIPGIGTKLLGARRWINLGFFNLQPAELAKFSICVYLAALLKKTSSFAAFLFPVAVFSGLVFLEPDLGTAMVVSIGSLITYFVITGKITQMALAAPVALLLLLAVIFLSPYRASRFQDFLNSSHDTQGSSYQIRQALLALGSGGITGVGLGQSREKYEFLPEVTTDSIFAVIGEELGLIGAVVLLVVFFLLISTGLQVAARAPAPFSANLALAVTSLLAVQAFLNISAIIALLPLTGIPLPFISYGGSSLVIVLLSMGILVNIARSDRL